ncbi:MAG: 16S rRNA (cytosine(967)-C(5))-methyltransferase RsmB [Lactobacillales bacterium]|jgi:16S rRNA (cytosine967-C5)-methyltransferase|nr:16S rRNA (cytosine(967)-C(5))-methyltransferase RsmB [Lactobacillales bacterium]
MGKKISNKIQRNPRFLAMLTVERVNKGNAYSNLLLNDMINDSKLSDLDRRLFTELVYGTIARKLTLEYYLTPFLAKAKKVDAWVKTLLALSVYQMKFLDKIPDHAIINDAVEIAKQYGNPGAGKFVNGVLRNVQRQGLPEIEAIKDKMKRLSVELSMPQWLCEKLVTQLGFEEARELGLSLFEPSRVSARVDTRKLSIEEVVDALAEEDIEARPSKVSPYGVVAEKGFLAGSMSFAYGMMTIQDESSMLVAPSLQIEPSNLVLDACAAPGGKTTHIATFLDKEQGGKVIALDIHEHKLHLVEQNAERLHVADVVETELLDARKVQDVFEKEQFDRILVDAPCSGLGLMRRKPDIKYHKNSKDFLQLQKIQLEILESVAPTLKKSGIMTYSTCTIVEEENSQVVDAFLNAHPEFEKINIPVNSYVQAAVKDGMLQIMPNTFMTDGFFICSLRKK